MFFVSNLTRSFQKDWIPGKRFTRICADKRRRLTRIEVMGAVSGFATLGAAEVRSAEATELPVWERPPASVANGFCHPLAGRVSQIRQSV